ncbi:hypothetical protein Sgleb_04420 [Streptomyces glebosus]|uniref:Uncharacterized protein n=1 Tax=Streptomyces glebosus TaxID=249580 RepID=A0A640SSC4_9ACTN|nr:hypothetical protein Sgleb_04420 [Streptomyces glebosus]GHG82955.1 hypothetical protein GCM10010513_62250 [Streptomyces glebosus]
MVAFGAGVEGRSLGVAPGVALPEAWGKASLAVALSWELNTASDPPRTPAAAKMPIGIIRARRRCAPRASRFTEENFTFN